MRRILGMSVLLAGLVVGVAALGEGQESKPSKSTSNNVTIVVHDDSSAGTEVLMRSDDYNGSGEATYGGAIVGGELDLSLLKQSLRTLWITPNDPVGSQPAAPPAGYYSEGVQSLSRCFDQNGNTVPLENVVTSSGNCKLGVNFDSGGTLYKLLMSPFPFSGSEDGTPKCPSTGCPTTGSVTVTCNKVSNSECVSWTIVPNTSAAYANVANLYWYEGGKNSIWVFIGQYDNTFRIDVTNP
jgi:hypothetical protein